MSVKELIEYLGGLIEANPNDCYVKVNTVVLLEAKLTLQTMAKSASTVNDSICQTLGRALGYPRYADDQRTFPGATDKDGVCVGEHVAETLADEAAGKLKDQQETIDRLHTVCGDAHAALTKAHVPTTDGERVLEIDERVRLLEARLTAALTQDVDRSPELATSHFGKAMPLVTVLFALAAQEGNDFDEGNAMQAAGEHIVRQSAMLRAFAAGLAQAPQWHEESCPVHPRDPDAECTCRVKEQRRLLTLAKEKGLLP